MFAGQKVPLGAPLPPMRMVVRNGTAVALVLLLVLIIGAAAVQLLSAGR